jgi:glutamate 5-kinase
MVTKLKAAQLGTAAGVTVVIMNTQRIESIETALAAGEAAALAEQAAAALGATGAAATATAAAASSSSEADAAAGTAAASSASLPMASRPLSFSEAGIGTTFLPSARPVTGRKRWILSLNPEGAIVLDRGAVAAVVEARKSLFPAGVSAVQGDFDAQSSVQILSEEGQEVARALINYGSDECRKLRGRRSGDIADALGYLGAEALCDRDNIVVLGTAGEKREGEGGAGGVGGGGTTKGNA